jgi:hypothetical protein
LSDFFYLSIIRILGLHQFEVFEVVCENVSMCAVGEVEGDGIGVGRKKKVFKRFNKF